MSYAPSDPRSALVPPAASAPTGDVEPMAMQYFDFSRLEPDEVSERGSRSWIVRARNVVFVLTELVEGDTLARDDQDETALLATSADGSVRITAGSPATEPETATVRGETITMIPPGPSTVTALGPTRVVRLFPLSAADLVARSRNAAAYADGAGAAAEAIPWPAPADGHRLRVYADIAEIPAAEGRLGRIFRNQHVMINALYPRVGPRDPSTLSPHTHDDFEQLSYVDEGSYVHHIRTAWGRDRNRWRPDEHEHIGAPSLAIIAPPLLHTSEAVGAGTNRMYDIFAGPRADFSSRPGWVLNATDYPAPEGLG